MTKAFVFAAAFFLSVPVAAASPVEGVWLSEEKDGYIVLKVENGKLVGRGKAMPGAKERLDVNNPDPKLRSRSLAGAKILWGFEPDNDEKTKWVDGNIYDPGNGKTYSCKLRLEEGKLKIRGYVGISLFGRSTTWTRVKS